MSVYFIFQEGDDTRCKIGKSLNPKYRLKQLQIGNPDKLELYETLDGYTQLENELHQRFDEQRIKNTEWFYLTKEEVDEIVAEYRGDESEERDVDMEEKDNISDNETVELVEETETTIIKKKVYKQKNVEKPFVCTKCNKGFKQQEHLNKHLNRVNACDATYECDKCGNTFNSGSLLKRHLSRKTPCVVEELQEIPIITNDNVENRCNVCNKKFASAYSLKRHQNTGCNVASNPQTMIHLMESVISLQKQVLALQQNQTTVGK